MTKRLSAGILALCSALLCSLTAAMPARAEEQALRIGIAPHTSARVIVEQYQPVRRAVEQALGRPVEIVTAPDFTAFARRALDQDYDVAVTTGHQAQLLRKDAGYLPLLTYKADFRALVVTAAKGPYRTAESLAGTTVLGLSPSSLVTLWGQRWLADRATPDIQLRYVSAADSVAQLILAGDASAGFMSLANLAKLSPEVQAQLATIAESPPMAGRAYMLNGKEAALAEPLRKALLAFGATNEGKTYFDSNQLGGYRPLTDAELEAMEPMAEEVRRVLKAGK
ncbi:phosphate/phosphite/phosphonate ABC transporter substrate-binding protein [Azospirillum lipoferum]|uniref:Phosphate/phosphonate ABC-type transporter, periplasmic component n=1 Tax=Azospirillum lipoferum (strain 4B) TaxID=862719 RepID=G7ZG57_AZOL4|nr:phosphate/phosphite/phosphonate ABC transporter substrate-binding protein [Azospirillum lipoferum]CBS90751.1 putative phosphate/phosphonate ABC-type transporter, periplasmic component [Azospirillum lipoferum 4B]